MKIKMSPENQEVIIRFIVIIAIIITYCLL